MKKRFEKLTYFISGLENDSFGEWIINRENDGSIEHLIQLPFVNYSQTVLDFRNALFDFCDKHPEYEHTRYAEVLEQNGLGWDAKIMEEAKPDTLNEKTIIALLVGAFRAERFCDGALLGFLNDGCILKWLKRLSEIDEQNY